MHLTVEQLRAAERGEAVRIEAGGKKYVLLSQGVYEDSLDFSPWTTREIDALADEGGRGRMLAARTVEMVNALMGERAEG